MDDIQKMFRTIIKCQSDMRSEILAEIDSMDKKLSGMIDSLGGNINIDVGFKKVNESLDKLELSIANFRKRRADRRRFRSLEVRVINMEQRAVSM